MEYRYIYRRNSHYHFRIRVPLDILACFDAPFIRKSLKTKSLLEAQHVSNMVGAEFRQLFAKVKSVRLKREKIKEMVSKILESGLDGLKGLRIEGEKIKSLTGGQPKAIQLKVDDRLPKTMLSKLILEYVKEHTTANKWGAKSKVEYDAFLKIFLEIIGDIDINGINREKINDFKEKLLCVPANRNKNPIYRGKSIDEILSMEDVQPMSLSRINKNLTVVSSMFKWARKFGFVKDNPAEGLQVKITHRASEERKAYDKEDLIKIVRKLSEIDRIMNPEDYWIPLIAMFSGMRLNEICQLHIGDIRKIDGILCFDINNNHTGKKTKTRASVRIIPIHPILIEIGFLDFVKCIKDGQLWKSLRCHEFNGYGYLYQKRYSNFNRKYITQDKKKVFHSFRHTVINSLKQSGVIEQRIAEIVGHTTGSIDMERYGKSYNPRVQLETLKKLDYGYYIVKELSA